MIACTKCKSTNANSARFCQNCGTSLFYPKPGFLKRNWGCLLASIISLGLLVIPVFLLLALVGSLTHITQTPQENKNILEGRGPDSIALITINGIILETETQNPLGSISDEITSSRKIRKLLNELKEDESIKSVILRINSPGGSAAASEEINNDLKKFKEETKLPVTAYISDMAASGGYYIAAQADTIVANPSSMTGSIGVIISYLGLSELAQTYGIESIVYKSGPYKDIGNALRKPTTQEDQIMQDLVNDAYEVFVSAVSEGRGMPANEVRLIADGAIYSSTNAKQLGLIDEIGTFTDALNIAKQHAQLSEASLIEYGQPTIWEALLGSITRPLILNQFTSISSSLGFTKSPRLLYLYTP